MASFSSDRLLNEFQGHLQCRLLFFSPHIVYRKISIISPGLIFVQKAVLLRPAALIFGELIFGGANFTFKLGLA